MASTGPMCSSNGVTRKVVATIVAAASLTALLYYHKTRKRGKEKEEDQDSSSVVDKEVPAAGWNDGVRLELTVERPGDLKRRIFKSEHTTLTIEKVGNLWRGGRHSATSWWLSVIAVAAGGL